MRSASSAPPEEPSRESESIQHFESALRQVVDTVPVLWCSKLADGLNDFSNQRWWDYTGISSEEARGWGWQAAVHRDDFPTLMETWLEMLEKGEPWEFETRLR